MLVMIPTASMSGGSRVLLIGPERPNLTRRPVSPATRANPQVPARKAEPFGMDDTDLCAPRLRLLADLSARLLRPAPGELDAAIVAGLGRVAEMAGATRVRLGGYAWPATGPQPEGTAPVQVGELGLWAPVPDDAARSWLAAAETVLAAAVERRDRLVALAEAEELYRTMLDDLPTVVVRLDALGRITYLNRAWVALTGIPVAEMLGKDPLYHVHPEDRETAAAHMAQTLNGNDAEVRAARFIRSDGADLWMEVGGRVIFNEAGQPIRMIGFMQDVTGRQAAREHSSLALDRSERAREHAERASRSKSEFLSRMSHELRTPLNAILGFAQLMGDAELDEENADNLAQIERAGRLLLALVNDALDVARIETGNLSVALEPVPVGSLVAESLDLVRPAAAARNLTVRVATDGVDDHKVLADPNRLRQVLGNLLSNAVKYNVDGGQIEVNCRPLPGTEQPGGRPRLRIAVSDTGPGIPADRMDEVFLPFERLGWETSGVEGTGLGLSVTKTIVEAMGGSIGVGSVVGIGTTFYVDLPIA